MNENDLTDDEVLELARETGKDPGEILDAWEAMGSAKTLEPKSEMPWDWSGNKLMQNIGQGIANIPSNIYQGVKGVVGAVGDIAEETAATGNFGQAVARKVYDNPAGAARLATGAALGAAFPPSIPLQLAGQWAVGPALQAAGLEETPTMEENVQRLAGDLASSGIAGTVSKVTGALNSPRMKAEASGANPSMFRKGASGNSIERSFERLQGTPEGEAIFNKLTTGGAEETARQARGVAGQNVGDFYKNNPGVQSSLDDVMSTEGYQSLLEGKGSLAQRSVGRPNALALRELDQIIEGAIDPNTGKVDIGKLHKTKVELNSRVGKLYGKQNLSTADEAALDVYQTLGDTIDQAIERLDPAKAAELRGLNRTFSDLSKVQEAYDIGQSQPTFSSLRSLASVTGNPVRALINRAQGVLPSAPAFGAGMAMMSAPQPLPRNTETISNDPNSLNMVAQLGVNSGILPNHETLLNAPLPAQKEMIKAIVSQNPELAEPTPDGYRSVMDGKIGDPMEQSMYMKSALDAIASGKIDPKEEPRMMGGFIEHKRYTPIGGFNSPAVMPKQPVQFSLSDLDMALTGAVGGTPTYSAEPDSLRMLKQAAKYPAAY